MNRLLSFIIIGLLVMSASALGAEYYVAVDGDDIGGSGAIDSPFASIQHGLDVANYGDYIYVRPGIYFENINYDGRLITVASLYLITHDVNYISQTIIDGGGSGKVVTFEFGEDLSAILCGFTITHGFASGIFPVLWYPVN